MSTTYELIKTELAAAKHSLGTRLNELDRAREHEAELVTTCAGLRLKIAELENGIRALDRGYIAIMGDADRAPTPIAHGTETSVVEASKPALQATEVKR